MVAVAVVVQTKSNFAVVSIPLFLSNNASINQKQEHTYALSNMHKDVQQRRAKIDVSAKGFGLLTFLDEDTDDTIRVKDKVGALSVLVTNDGCAGLELLGLGEDDHLFGGLECLFSLVPLESGEEAGVVCVSGRCVAEVSGVSWVLFLIFFCVSALCVCCSVALQVLSSFFFECVPW